MPVLFLFCAYQVNFRQIPSGHLREKQAYSSGRGLRWVQNIVQTAKGMCKKITDNPCHLSCVPKKGEPKEGHPAKILNAMLGRPQYISETRPSGSDSPKCFTLGLGRLAKFSHGTAVSV